MRTQNITMQNFNGNKINVLNSGKNKEVKFLYNKVRDVIDEFKPTAVFKNEGIFMDSYSNKQTKDITKALKERNIEHLINNKKPAEFLELIG